jgi:putative toxin-antitoxin system antitoxin component (TIGR02293 family)
MHTAAQIIDFLNASPISYRDCDRIIREGIPWEAVAGIKKELELTDDELAGILDISERTLSRLRQSGKKLTASTGDRLYRLVHIYSLARRVFEGDPAAREWLHHPQVGLNVRSPLDLLQTEAGAREVEDLLGRIEYGIMS